MDSEQTKKLPPLNLQEDNEKYKAFSESKKIEFVKCNHKNIKFVNGELRCSCGVVYTGQRLGELYKLLTA